VERCKRERAQRRESIAPSRCADCGRTRPELESADVGFYESRPSWARGCAPKGAMCWDCLRQREVACSEEWAALLRSDQVLRDALLHGRCATRGEELLRSLKEQGDIVGSLREARRWREAMDHFGVAEPELFAALGAEARRIEAAARELAEWDGGAS